MADVYLFQTPDGGDIEITAAGITTDEGILAAVYLALFGGNEDDDGAPGNPLAWWGNLDENEPARQYRSETQHILASLPATSGNLLRVEDAVRRDIAPLVSAGLFTDVEVSARLTGLNRIEIDIEAVAIGRENSITFSENWRAINGA